MTHMTDKDMNAPGVAELASAQERADAPTPPCRVCGKSELVACYWPEHPERAICVECCAGAEHDDGEAGHVWTYDRAEVDRVCDRCGQFARNTDYYAEFDYD